MDDQKATNHAGQHSQKLPLPVTSYHDVTQPCLGQGLTAVNKNTHDLFERAKAQRIYMHGVITVSRCQAALKLSFPMSAT